MKRVFALVLVLSLLLSGCTGPKVDIMHMIEHPDRRDVLAWAASEMRYYKSLRPFPELAYESPDPQTLNGVFGEARYLAERGEDADALVEALDRAFDAYDAFYTLDTIAMIRADADQTDEYYRAEYDKCETMSAQVEQWYEQMLRACAASELRGELERRDYFAPGELDYYEQDETTYDDDLVALYQRESELLSEYRALRADDGVEIDGEKMSLDEYLARESLSEEEYNSAYVTWLQQMNGEAGRIYAELIGMRQDIAAKLGYDSYELYSYDYYERGYTPEEAEAWLQEIRQILGPYRQKLFDRGEFDRINYPALSERQLMDRLGGVMEDLGDPAAETFDFMRRYELYSVSADLRKAAMSYTAYLYSYDAPYLFVDAYGDVEDLVTVAHEFGHFLGARTQGIWNAPLDLDETWSQGMEFLVLEKLRGTFPEYDDLLRIKLLDILDTYTSQAAYSSFERAAFALPEDERTAERFNALCLQCMRDYGQIDGDETAAALWWTEVDHLFEMPFYMMSYCTSADAAMQLYQLALEDPDRAWDAYRRLLEGWDRPYVDALAAAGLEDPLTPGRISGVEATIEAQLPD